MLLRFSHKYRDDPQHKSLFFPCNRNPEETPPESALQEINYWTPTLWLWPVLAFGLGWRLGLQNSWLADNHNWERTIVLMAFFMHMMVPQCKENIVNSPGVCCCCCLWQCSRQSEPVRSNRLHQLPSLRSLFLIFSLIVKNVSGPD